jgi:hypothetical protein
VQLVEQVDVEVAELAAKVFARLRHAGSFVVMRLSAVSHSTIPGPVAYLDPDPPRLVDQPARRAGGLSELARSPSANSELVSP